MPIVVPVPHQARSRSIAARIFVVRWCGKTAGRLGCLSRFCRAAWRQKDRRNTLGSGLAGHFQRVYESSAVCIALLKGLYSVRILEQLCLHKCMLLYICHNVNGKFLLLFLLFFTFLSLLSALPSLVPGQALTVCIRSCFASGAGSPRSGGGTPRPCVRRLRPGARMSARI